MLLLNPPKSQLVHFKERNKPNLSTSINLFNNVISNTNNATFLGVIFDHHALFTKYIDNISGKAWGRLQSLKNLLQNSKLNPELGLRIYQTLIRPILEYGSICYLTASSTSFRKLERINTTANRLAYKIPSYISQQQVLLTSHSQTLRDLIINLNTKLTRNYLLSDPLGKDIILRLLTIHPKNTIKVPVDLLNYKNWAEVVDLVEGGGRGVL